MELGFHLWIIKILQSHICHLILKRSTIFCCHLSNSFNRKCLRKSYDNVWLISQRAWIRKAFASLRLSHSLCVIGGKSLPYVLWNWYFPFRDCPFRTPPAFWCLFPSPGKQTIIPTAIWLSWAGKDPALESGNPCWNLYLCWLLAVWL